MFLSSQRYDQDKEESNMAWEAEIEILSFEEEDREILNKRKSS